MLTESKLSQYSYQPFLKAVYQNKLSRDHLGQRAIDGDRYVICRNSQYVIKDISTDEEVAAIDIPQNSEGIDIEDRIVKMRSIAMGDSLS